MSQPRSVTISDVARAAGVSPMTVSRVLRGTGRIGAATRERVAQIAEAMGYVPNGLAGALSSQTSRLVGVLIPSISDQVYAGVLSGINATLGPAGLTALIGETFFDPANEERLVRMILSMKPAGLILTGGLHRTGATAHLLRQSGLRTVQLWDGDRPAFDATVGLSHLGAGRTVAGLFLSAGFRRIAYVGADLPRDLCAALRLDGLAADLCAAGAELAVHADPDLPRTAEGGEAMTARLLREGPLPQAIHYLNDAMAIGGLRALHAAGVAVPDRVSVVGFNGTAEQHMIRTRLATLAVPLREVGERAAAAVIRPEGVREVDLVTLRLIRGTTLAPLATGET